MKHIFTLFICISLTYFTSLVSFAKPYPKAQYDQQYDQNDNILRIDGDGIGGLLGIMSGTLLSLSSLDEMQRSQHIAIIQHAEVEAVKFEAGQKPSATFLTAKAVVENLNQTSLTNEQAAIVIAELNQKFRE